MLLDLSKQGNEAELVTSAQEGSSEAFAELYRLYRPRVLKFLWRRFGGLKDKEDLAQEVFLSAWSKIKSLRKPIAFGAWLILITRNRAINRLRRQSHEVRQVDGAIDLICDDRPIEEDFLFAEKRTKRVKAALMELSKVERESVINFYWRGLSLVETAKCMTVPIGTVKRRLHVARRRLKETLSEKN